MVVEEAVAAVMLAAPALVRETVEIVAPVAPAATAPAHTDKQIYTCEKTRWRSIRVGVNRSCGHGGGGGGGVRETMEIVAPVVTAPAYTDIHTQRKSDGALCDLL